MKKIVLAVVAVLALMTMAHATKCEHPEPCEPCADGVDGIDGKDGVVNYSYLKNVYNRIAESNAGSASMAVIDFGTVAKGETAGGLGIGAGDTGQERKWAVGAGVKHGMTDKTAVVVKGYYGTGGHANAVGAGVVHKF